MPLNYFLCLPLLFVALCAGEVEDDSLKVWLTISAQSRLVEVSWKNARAHSGDSILVTNQEPVSFQKVKLLDHPDLSTGFEGSGGNEGSGLGIIPIAIDRIPSPSEYWTCNSGAIDILSAIKPKRESQWITTSIPFDFDLSKNVTVHSKCYGYWASYIDAEGNILHMGCIRAYPTWMNDMKSVVGNLRIRDLFIPGTHDSGSYKPGFDPALNETLVTKYALTQDDDIRGQLMHGARYLDIRVGYYRNTEQRFYVNHGITRQRPLSEVIEQVRDFILRTNEIVIFGVKEFPVGFGKNLDVHRLLVQYFKDKLGDLLVDPSFSWQVLLRDVWQRKQNIFLAYDHMSVVSEFPTILYGPVEQRWGNVRKWSDLERFLKMINGFDTLRLSSRPVADMAELTPDTWGVISGKYGGLRKMADDVNSGVSLLYRDELSESANIVAVDFMRGTNIVDLALDTNAKKVIL